MKIIYLKGNQQNGHGKTIEPNRSTSLLAFYFKSLLGQQDNVLSKLVACRE